jgi:hypothetical protein
MKVIRTRVGVAVGSLGLLASAFGLTVITASSVAPTGVAAAISGHSVTQNPNATLIDP